MKLEDTKELVSQLKEAGFARTHIRDFLKPSEMHLWEDAKLFFQKMLESEKIQQRITRINNSSSSWDKKKIYEIGAYEYLGRGLSLEDNAIQLFLAPSFIEIATQFYNTKDFHIFNILTWIHTFSKRKSRMASQNWHRDQEDHHQLKCFIYFGNVFKDNGAIQYCKKSFTGAVHDSLATNMEKGKSGKQLASPRINQSSLPSEDVVTAEGGEGTIFFINTNGFHRGGFVKRGEETLRKVMHCVFLKTTAHHIQHGPYYNFNYDKKINEVSFTSKEFEALSEDAKKLFLK